jgi:hypothetical protein
MRTSENESERARAEDTLSSAFAAARRRRDRRRSRRRKRLAAHHDAQEAQPRCYTEADEFHPEDGVVPSHRDTRDASEAVRLLIGIKPRHQASASSLGIKPRHQASASSLGIKPRHQASASSLRDGPLERSDTSDPGERLAPVRRTAMPRGRRGPHAPTAPRAPLGATLDARFRHAVVEDPDGCWLWNGPWLPSHQAGYLVIDARKRLAHRVAWELAHGPIPPAHRVIRTCAQARCVNPAHRTLVAHQAAHPAASRKAAEPHAPPEACPYGHPYDESNTIWQRGSRVCRECHRRRNRERWRRLKQQVAASH